MEKSKIVKLESGVRKCEKNLARLEKKEEKARARWTREYHSYEKATENLAKLKRFGTQRHKRLQQKVLGWPQRSNELTRGRDKAREAIAEQKAEITRLQIELSKVMQKAEAEVKVIDEIVDQVFMLNDAVISSLVVRNHYLSIHVFELMVDKEGNLRSQLTLINSDGTKKVVALVNTISLVVPDLAEKAMEEIESFFARLRPKAEMDESTQVLYDLTKKVLVEKTRFKVGPELYRFLSLELDREKFPELRRAQDLLKKSLRSEKTNSYIRLYKRASRADKWEPIRQT